MNWWEEGLYITKGMNNGFMILESKPYNIRDWARTKLYSGAIISFFEQHYFFSS